MQLNLRPVRRIELYATSVLNAEKTSGVLFCFTLQGSTDNIRDYLPIELDQIKHASDKCLVLAKEVEKKFDDLMMLTGRILEVSLVAKGSHEDQLKKAGNITSNYCSKGFQSSTHTIFIVLFCS